MVRSWMLLALVPVCLAALPAQTAAGSRRQDEPRPPVSPGGRVVEGMEAALDPTPGDWLVEPAPRPARVHVDRQAGRLIMANGLVARTFSLAPDGATIGLDEMPTRRSLLRAIKPEATVTLDGVPLQVGGLQGQPDHAFLAPDWLDDLRPIPGAMHLVSFEVGEIEARFPYRPVRHHAPGLAWPPDGVTLAMRYRLSAAPVERLDDQALPSAAGRPLLFATDFEPLSSEWAVHRCPAHERSSFTNEGKPGEIYTPGNTAVFAERALPAGTRLVELTLDPGTDRSASWGPGLALVWKERTLKLNLRPGGGAWGPAPSAGIWDGGRERPRAGGDLDLDLTRPISLRMRLTDDAVRCEVLSGEEKWIPVARLDRAGLPGDPLAVRVGKLDPRGGPSDHPDHGDWVRCRMIRCAAYGALDAETLRTRRDRAAALESIEVIVHHELYDGLPLLGKWITVRNGSERTIALDRYTSEQLAVVEPSSWLEEGDGQTEFDPPIHVETDYAFAVGSAWQCRHAVHWVADPEYLTQVDYQRRNRCLLEVGPEIGPAARIGPGESFESFRTFELVFDATDRERRGLAVRRMYRTLAPWVTENPLMQHVRYADPDTVATAIDQCARVGFEMLILTFGSGFNIENDDPDYLAAMKRYADQARAKGLEIGGYSLLASRHVGGGNDVVLPAGQRPRFGNSPCLQSTWGRDYFDKLYRFFDETGFMLLEHDGSYPGDPCGATDHPGHRGYADSRWSQWRQISDFYHWCRGRGIYLNVPDWYYLSGANKGGMGYRETNWSLPRPLQVIHTRQNIYDGTWRKTPSMGWMFVPLVEYHGGGAAATIEPLADHLDHYGQMLASNLAFGVQACYRGPRLFDAPQTEALVAGKVRWFKKYRDILESDLIHGRRADGRDLDWMLHVNARLDRCGLLVVFNPLRRAIERSIDIDLYYTGLESTARVRHEEGPGRLVALRRDHSIELQVSVGPRAMTYYVFERPDR